MARDWRGILDEGRSKTSYKPLACGVIAILCFIIIANVSLPYGLFEEGSGDLLQGSAGMGQHRHLLAGPTSSTEKYLSSRTHTERVCETTASTSSTTEEFVEKYQTCMRRKMQSLLRRDASGSLGFDLTEEQKRTIQEDNYIILSPDDADDKDPPPAATSAPPSKPTTMPPSGSGNGGLIPSLPSGSCPKAGMTENHTQCLGVSESLCQSFRCLCTPDLLEWSCELVTDPWPETCNFKGIPVPVGTVLKTPLEVCTCQAGGRLTCEPNPKACTITEFGIDIKVPEGSKRTLTSTVDGVIVNEICTCTDGAWDCEESR